MADNFIPTGQSAIESADSELESAVSIADPPKIDVWVRALKGAKGGLTLDSKPPVLGCILALVALQSLGIYEPMDYGELANDYIPIGQSAI